MGKSLRIIACALTLVCMMAACEKDALIPEGLVSDLEFSCDTLAFDTVFVQMGTSVRQVKLYNKGLQAVRISSVTLQGGYASRFRLNVDGDTSMVVRDVDIAPGDSVFIFVRANINPNASTEPFLVQDAILFTSSQTQKRLPLTAYGRNAVYHVPDHVIRYADGAYPVDAFGNQYRYSIIDCDNWNHALPHVIVGYAVVDSRNTLSLVAGDELYFYNDAVLWVYDSATLKVQGTDEEPVLFTSVRHDGWYDDLPGQWGYVWLSAGSKDNKINNAVIKNAYCGLLVDTNVNDNPTLDISNSVICNHTLAGILGQTAYIVGDNLLVFGCGTATLALQYGGRYRFTRSTFADYWSYGSRTNPSVILNNYRTFQSVRYLYDLPMAQFVDCIIYGSRAEGEMLLDLDDRAACNVNIVHSIVRGGDWDVDPKFMDPQEGDYHLMDGSPAVGIGYRYPEVSEQGTGKLGHRNFRK